MRVVKFVLFAFIILQMCSLKAQQPILDVGLRLQKSINLYAENGVSASFSTPKFGYDKVFFGIAYVSSRLGSAWGTNAIKQDNFLFSVGHFGRKGKLIRPFARLNSGWFNADYESDLFDDLDHQSLILAPDFGISLEAPFPVKVQCTFGYHLITGDGTSGPGTLYPLFIQSTVSWNIFRN